MRRLRHMALSVLVQGHAANKWHSRDPNLGSLACSQHHICWLWDCEGGGEGAPCSFQARTTKPITHVEIHTLKCAELESRAHNQRLIHRMARPYKNNSAGQKPQRAWGLLRQWIKIYTLWLKCAEMEFNSPCSWAPASICLPLQGFQAISCG